MQKVAILGGLGIEGRALQKYLKKTRPDLKPVILDRQLDPNYLSRLREFNLIYRTPGVLCNLPEIRKAIRAGIKFSSPMNLFFEKARGMIIGITGSKGKGTTAQILYEILKSAGKDVYLGGNIGNSPLEFVDKLTGDSITVLELSNLQLWDIRHSPHIAVILDVFPEHLDWHRSFQEYIQSKTGIVKYQHKGDLIFYMAGNKFSKKIANKSKGKKVEVEPHSLPKRSLMIPGKHNLKNASMAAAVCSHLGIGPDTILHALSKTKGLPYRLQKVRDVSGVTYYNDSASTAPETAVAAAKAFPKDPKILLLGGRDKNSDYSVLERGLREEKIKLAIIFGASKEKINTAIKRTVKTKLAKDLPDAVETARKITKSGDVILFSPGATSLDMFKNYKDRGQQFDKIVKKIKD
ncbi:MAG: UDP-N-acetylmuramoyl-L-alanine--D-glutamate ligase [Candidatus Colwellbacteria bacterium]|nr:UDP-N-acetylmuramoyl-L-alanine--D-glutamate ligase [Candidatus Colwellbacteria bacterium]